MGERSLSSRLQAFGFSEKEAAVYEAVLAFGEAKASEVASAADVSTRYAYEVAESLEDRGFLRVHDYETPTTMEALPPEEVIADLTADLTDLKPVLRDRYDSPSEEPQDVEVMRTRITLTKRIRSLIDTAESELALSLPVGALEDFADDLRAARERGVLVMLIVTHYETPPDVSDIADLVRIEEYSKTSVVAADARAAMVMTANMLMQTNTDDFALACYDSRIGRLGFSGFIGNVWLRADEYHIADPVDLPATFDHIRHAVLHATLHRRAGTDLTVDVEGRWVDANEPVSIEGRLIDTTQGLIEPRSASFPSEMSLRLETEQGEVTVGGWDAYLEDIEMRTITIRPR